MPPGKQPRPGKLAMLNMKSSSGEYCGPLCPGAMTSIPEPCLDVVDVKQEVVNGLSDIRDEAEAQCLDI